MREKGNNDLLNLEMEGGGKMILLRLDSLLRIITWFTHLTPNSIDAGIEWLVTGRNE